jgi:hypothetical protein
MKLVEWRASFIAMGFVALIKIPSLFIIITRELLSSACSMTRQAHSINAAKTTLVCIHRKQTNFWPTRNCWSGLSSSASCSGGLALAVEAELARTAAAPRTGAAAAHSGARASQSWP